MDLFKSPGHRCDDRERRLRAADRLLTAEVPPLPQIVAISSRVLPTSYRPT